MNCPLCGEEYGVETKCVSSETVYDEEGGEWISMQGFVERRKCCQKCLGDGYGDVNYFKTQEQADQETATWKKKIGEWW